MSICLDTSFLVSLYALDANSAAAAQAFQNAADTLLITTFTEFELVNALQLGVFRKQLSPASAQLCLRNFEDDIGTGTLKLRPLAESVFTRALQLSRETTAQLGTRAADILHVAAALESGSAGFYSFDRQQRQLAQTVGLKINS